MFIKKNEVKIALNICTYQREEYIHRNLSLLRASYFFDWRKTDYYGKLHIFIVDNARKLKIREDEYTHLVYNKIRVVRVAFREELKKFENKKVLRM